MTRPDPHERGGASVRTGLGPWIHLPQAEYDELKSELSRVEAAWKADLAAADGVMIALRADLTQARAETDDLVAKAWDAAKAGIDQLTQERDQAQATILELAHKGADEVERNDQLRAENQALRAALEKHHWPDLVPGDGPCETCGLKAEARYGIAALDGQAQPRDEGTTSS